MHQLKVLILGPNSFSSTLNELKPFLKFNSLREKNSSDFDVVLFHEDALNDKEDNKIIRNTHNLKVLASSEKKKYQNFDAFLELPSSLREINAVIESVTAKKVFSKNSSIEIKKYLLNKNEKKLSKNENEIILTEKEIQLLELFLNNKKPISKNKILSSVWNYSSDADTHTVETHIYRLRKKINDKFSDDNFIVNTKDGYSLWRKEIKSQKIYLQTNIEKELLNLKKEKVVLKEKKSKLFFQSSTNYLNNFWRHIGTNY